MNVEAEHLCIRYNAIRQARRVYDLLDHTQRKEWENTAYEPRIDYGEDTPLRVGFHVDPVRNIGWRD